MLVTCLLWWHNVSAQVSDQVTAIQYYFDTDPGVNVAGNGAIISVTPGTSISETFAVSLPPELQDGIHYLYVRVKDDLGRWSLTERRPVYAIPIEAAFASITAIQYYFDTDPGINVAGNGAIINIVPGMPVTHELAITLPPGISSGLHYIYTRVKNEFGAWSLSERRAIYILPVDDFATAIDAVQYYFDTDPGVGVAGNGAVLTFAATELYNTTVAISLPELTPGLHYLYLRTRSATGHAWSFSERRPVYVIGSQQTEQVVALEYYFDNDPGAGNGNEITVEPSSLYTSTVELGVPCLSTGTHYVYIRALDEDGKWSILARDTISIASGLASTDITPAGPVTMCTGESVLLSGTEIPGATYQWLLNGSDIAGATSITYNANETGMFSLKTTCGAAFTTSNVISVSMIPLVTYYADSDGDSFGDPTSTVAGCTAPPGYVANNADCDDANAFINPSVIEICNEIDDDCDAIIDDGVQTQYYVDLDGDGFGNELSSIMACSLPVGYVIDHTDCDDANLNINPSAIEVCNSIDDNCNGLIDDGALNTFYADADGDGYGDPLVIGYACLLPVGYVVDNTDCNDADALAHPGQTWYIDTDEDQYGDGSLLIQCARPLHGYVTSELIDVHADCNNANADIFPGAVELCNTLDDNCNGTVDEGVMLTFYADTDGDGFGDPTATLLACEIAAGYVIDNTDCDDNNSIYHPGQVYFIDEDADGYSNGTQTISCLPPLNYFPEISLISINGDCDDSDPLINNGAQLYTFSGNLHFTESLVYPTVGDSYQEFRFEVLYVDASNGMPAPSWPRVVIDYENNGVFTDPNDRTIMLSAEDAADVNTTDGKRYFAVIDGLTPGLDYRVYIQSGTGCIPGIGPRADFIVSELPDLEVFASDITFSDYDPMPGDIIEVSATIHNASTQDAGAFYVHLVNQYNGTSYPDVYVPFLNAESATTVMWTITTPLEPAWCPMSVTADNTYQISESNELDNSAARPFVNGDYYVPGDILASGWISPSTTYNTVGSYVNVTGYAMYIETAVPMPDPDVAGAQVFLTIEETGASFICYTNADGYFSTAIPTELPVGTYHIIGTVTDFTLMDTMPTLTFSVIPYPSLPDLETIVDIYSSSILAGGAIDGSITVKNVGTATTTAISLLDISQSDGTPVLSDVSIPVLAPAESFVYTFTGITLSSVGSQTICAMADPLFEITELYEFNNDDCDYVIVHSPLTDVFGGGSISVENCDIPPTSIDVSVTNGGFTATGSFENEVETFVDGISHGVSYFTITNILPGESNTTAIPFVNYGYGEYLYVIDLDYLETLSETSTINNDFSFGGTYTYCLPDLIIGECESVIMLPDGNPTPTAIDIAINVGNNGDGTATGPISLQLEIDGTTTYMLTHTGDIAPGGSAVFEITIPAPATGSTFSAEVNAGGAVVESAYFNNDYADVMCWDLEVKPLCTSDFWESVFVVGQYVYPVIAVENNQLYQADEVEVQFSLEGPGIVGYFDLGRTSLFNVATHCGPCGIPAAAPSPYQFLEPGTYYLTMVVDPDGDFNDCVPANNTLVVTIEVTGDPDLRILSEYIQPSLLNPDENEPITFDISYDNVGYENVGDLCNMELYVDGILQETITDLPGLMNGDNYTVSSVTSWFSALSGLHIVTAKIDSDDDVYESTNLNNEATRGVIVGASSNLGFNYMTASNPLPSTGDVIDISMEVINNGETVIGADVYVYYVTDMLDTILIGVEPVNIVGYGSQTIDLSWEVVDPSTTIVARILNGTALEFDYTDNNATLPIGAFTVTLFETPESCTGAGDGSILAEVAGGVSPYTFMWSTGYIGNTLYAEPGAYSVTVIDNTGMTVTATGEIAASVVSGTVYYADSDMDGYGNSGVSVSACEILPGFVENDLDCDDADITVYPGAVELCDAQDNDCDGMIDEDAAIATVSPAGTVTICNGQTVTLAANTGIGYTYLWYKNNKPIYTATASTYIANKAGSYKVKVTVPGGCFAISAVTTVVVNPAPNANVTAPFGTSLCTTVRLKAPNVATNTYQWRKGAAILAGATNFDYYPTTAGTYRCDVTNIYGCTKTSNAVTVTACDMGMMVNMPEPEMNIYPNPTTGSIHVTGRIQTTEPICDLIIYNAIGVAVYQEQVSLQDGDFEIALELDNDLPSGWYLVNVVSQDQRSSKLVLLQRQCVLVNDHPAGLPCGMIIFISL